MTKPRALEGVRVLDFTWVRAGPMATRWLGIFGAEVIKVEWPERLDSFRRNLGTAPPDVEPGPNSSGMFSDQHVGKRGITLNVRSDKGMDILKQLISVSDIVIENFSSRVMQSWGLSYEEQKKLNPEIIYVSMAGLGQTGPDHSYTTMGPSAQALSGMTYLSGLPGKPPAGWGWSYLDDSGGMYGAISALTALRHRDATGEGQHVDLSQMTAGITMTGSAFLDRTVNGRPSRRAGYPPGNRTTWPGTPVLNNYRGPTTAPHNAYRTKGDDYNAWCVIACFSDEEWTKLIEVMGDPDWAKDARFHSMAGRIQFQDAMDQGIESWTKTLDKYEVMERCQEAGVRAMPVQSSENRVEHDPQLKARGMFIELEHPVLGTRKIQNSPFKFSKNSVEITRPAPLIGQHTVEVMEDLLGFSRQEVSDGYDDGTFWPSDMPKHSYVEEALR
jgi:crotonobetainyl-CoA:carnitine CoA-transferase CaiB-like acyl-CoA transferase